MTNLYYKPPKKEYFDEVKIRAISIWASYDNTYGYATEKINKIKDLKNTEGNFMYMVAMFDGQNQAKLAKSLSDGAKKAIANRLKAGGTPRLLNNFLDK